MVGFVPYIISALYFGYAAWRTGSLWLAIGLHWANNAFLASLISSSSGDVIGSETLFISSGDSGVVNLVMTIVVSLTGLALTEWWVRRPGHAAAAPAGAPG